MEFVDMFRRAHSEEVAPKTVEQLMEDESLVLVEDVVEGGDEDEDEDDVAAPTMASPAPRTSDPAVAATSLCVDSGVEVGTPRMHAVIPGVAATGSSFSPSATPFFFLRAARLEALRLLVGLRTSTATPATTPATAINN